MSKPLILVTAAAGKTGARIVEQLVDRGFPVRALVRVLDERATRLEALGAQVVVGDLHDLASIRAALTGVKRAYFCYPPQETQLVDATAIFAIAARDAGVDAVVNMSQITAREDAPSPLSRQHWQAERVLDWAGIGAVHIKPTFFAENLFMFGAQTIADEGKLYFPFANESHAPIAAADIARVVAAILADPTGHEGQRYVLTGPELLTVSEMAGGLNQGLGIPVEYVDLEPARWADALRPVPGMSASLIKHLQAVAGDHRNGVFHVQTDTVKQITGHAAQPLDQFIQETRSEYGFDDAGEDAAVGAAT